MPESQTPDIVVFDLDGTLALIEHRRHFVNGDRKSWQRFFAACVDDEPNAPVIQLARMLAERRDLTLICFSGRSDEVRAETLAWLDQHVGSDVLIEPGELATTRRMTNSSNPGPSRFLSAFCLLWTTEIKSSRCGGDWA